VAGDLPHAERVLLVDDELGLLEVLREYLQEHGYEVGAVRTGEAALDALRDEAWDAVVLDLMLPGIGGLDVCRRVRARENFVPILVLSGSRQQHDKLDALEAGADAYLTKPVGMRELLARLRAALRRRGATGPEWSQPAEPPRASPGVT